MILLRKTENLVGWIIFLLIISIFYYYGVSLLLWHPGNALVLQGGHVGQGQRERSHPLGADTHSPLSRLWHRHSMSLEMWPCLRWPSCRFYISSSVNPIPQLNILDVVFFNKYSLYLVLKSLHHLIDLDRLSCELVAGWFYAFPDSECLHCC